MFGYSNCCAGRGESKTNAALDKTLSIYGVMVTNPLMMNELQGPSSLYYGGGYRLCSHYSDFTVLYLLTTLLIFIRLERDELIPCRHYFSYQTIHLLGSEAVVEDSLHVSLRLFDVVY